MAHRNDICDIFDASQLRLFREKQFNSRSEFARVLRVSRQAVDAWERGESYPFWRHVTRMAEILKIAARVLIIPSKRHILDRWEDHLIDYLEAPPEIRKQTKTEVVIMDENGSEKKSQTHTKRELKLTAKEAIELTERLGYFEEVENIQVDPAEEQQNSEIDEKLKKLLAGEHIRQI